VNEEDPERDRATKVWRRRVYSKLRSELRGGLRARPRYPGVEDLLHGAFLRETRRGSRVV